MTGSRTKLVYRRHRSWGAHLESTLQRPECTGVQTGLLEYLGEPPQKRVWKLSIPYLSHEICGEGIRAIPKIMKGVQDVPFPSALKGVQSLLVSLTYYHWFIEDFPVVAAILYELKEEQMRSGRDLSRAKEAFEIRKRKIVSTPLIRRSDRTKPFAIIFMPTSGQFVLSSGISMMKWRTAVKPITRTMSTTWRRFWTFTGPSVHARPNMSASTSSSERGMKNARCSPCRS